MKILLSVALAAASIGGVAIVAPASMSAQAAQPQVQPTAVALDTKLDTKTAKTGDPIVFKVLQDGKAGAVVVPNGSKLLGKILEAKSGSVVVLIESVQVKKADPTPVHATIAAMAKAPEFGPGGTASGSADTMTNHSGGDPLVMTALGSTIKNITLTSAKTAETSGTITSEKDFKLDKGTMFWLGLY